MHEGRYVRSTTGTLVHSAHLVVYLMYVATYIRYRFIPLEFVKVHAYVIFAQ